MNKKNIFLLLTAVLVTGSTLSNEQLSYAQEQERIERISLLSENNALSVVNYCANGRFENQLVERDIAIFEKDINVVLAKKSWAEGYLYSLIIPSVLKTIGLTSGAGALGAGAVAGVASYFFYDLWNSSVLFDNADYVAPTWIKVRYNTLSDRLDAWKDYYVFKYNYLMDNHLNKNDRAVLKIAPAYAAVGTGAAVVLAAVSAYSFKKLSNYKKRNAAFIQKLQERYERDQVVIAQLRQIQYSMNH